MSRRLGYTVIMIVLFTDFGLEGPYIGQMKAVLAREAPGEVIIDLFANAPTFDAQSAAYLLAAYTSEFPVGTVFLCVIDPGVGSERRVAAVKADGRWFVGPDNGLFNVVAMRAREIEWWDVTWRPETLSASFHGRDVFAPVAARLTRGAAPIGQRMEPKLRTRRGWSEDLARIVYIDCYGNAMTGLRAANLLVGNRLEINGHQLKLERTFSAVPPGHAFWYANANGLAEIAVNQGRAADVLGIELGATVNVI